MAVLAHLLRALHPPFRNRGCHRWDDVENHSLQGYGMWGPPNPMHAPLQFTRDPRPPRARRRRNPSGCSTCCSTALPLFLPIWSDQMPRSVSLFFSLFVLLDRHQIVAIHFRFPAQDKVYNYIFYDLKKKNGYLFYKYKQQRLRI